MGRRLVWKLGDNQIGAKNTESDGPTPQGKGLLVRGCEFPSRLTFQEPSPIFSFFFFLVGDL